jgi:ABC-type multidrug transport system permease subunit
MKPKILLRIAAILILVHSLLHTTGFSQWKKDPDPAKQEVIKQMTRQKFPFMGTSRNIGDYYDGFGYACSIALFLIAAALWIVSGELASSTRLAKKIIIVLGIALLFWAVDELLYFFPFAAGLTSVACLCCFWAFYLLNKQNQPAI